MKRRNFKAFYKNFSKSSNWIFILKLKYILSFLLRKLKNTLWVRTFEKLQSWKNFHFAFNCWKFKISMEKAFQIKTLNFALNSLIGKFSIETRTCKPKWKPRKLQKIENQKPNLETLNFLWIRAKQSGGKLVWENLQGKLVSETWTENIWFFLQKHV